MGETGVERQGRREGERTVVLIEFRLGGPIEGFSMSVQSHALGTPLSCKWAKIRQTSSTARPSPSDI